MDLERWLTGRDRRADLQHVSAENLMSLRRQMICVVFHERGAARQSFAHHFHGPDQRRGLPVALRAEAITFGHQALRPKARELPEPVQVLERRRKTLEAALLEERAQGQFEP